MREHLLSQSFCLSVSSAAAAASAGEVGWQPGWMSLLIRDSSGLYIPQSSAF